MPEIVDIERKLPILGKSKVAWEKLLTSIRSNYIMDEQWYEGKRESPYRDELKFRRGGKTLITLYIREGYFRAVVVLGKNERAKFEEKQTIFSNATRKIYDETNTLHDGKWLTFDVYDTNLIDDIINLIYMKRKPNRI